MLKNKSIPILQYMDAFLLSFSFSSGLLYNRSILF
jgi:hypothetical protein